MLTLFSVCFCNPYCRNEVTLWEFVFMIREPLFPVFYPATIVKQKNYRRH